MNPRFSISNWTSKSWAGALVAMVHVVFLVLLLQARNVISLPAAPPIEVSFVSAERPVTPEWRPQLPVAIETPKVLTAPVPEVDVEREPASISAASISAPTSLSNSQPAHSGPVLISEVEYLREPTLHYPSMSRRLREQGTVVLRVLVDEWGHAAQIDVHQSSGFPRLDEAACRALREAQFKPYVYEGRKQAALVMVPIEFSLRA